jgi:hypothetical protein
MYGHLIRRGVQVAAQQFSQKVHTPQAVGMQECMPTEAPWSR